jgi:hypothetical protein
MSESIAHLFGAFMIGLSFGFFIVALMAGWYKNEK